MELITSVMHNVFCGIPQIVLGCLILTGALGIYVTTSNVWSRDNNELKKNSAHAFCLGSYILAISIAMLPCFVNSNSIKDFFSLGLFGIVTIVLIRMSMVINDKLILASFENDYEILVDNNMGVSFVVAGSSIATGIILNGVFTGNSASFLLTLRDIFVYWIASQVILVIASHLYEYLWQRRSGNNVEKALETDSDLSAGIAYFGWFIAIGIIIRSAVAGASSDLFNELTITVVLAGLGILFMAITLLILNKNYSVTNSNLDKKDIGQFKVPNAILIASSFVAVALFIASKVTI